MILEIESIWDIMNGKYDNSMLVRFNKKTESSMQIYSLILWIFLMTGILFSKSSKKMGNLTMRILSR